ncbi:hypothetical protein [Treponema putidum]|uniref:hypothetical protein n=1 Tax=Treponema putidum TaxID=221027 RepID=UPI00210365EC|nr:hypothetical protein [Treponema putidum]
MSLDLTKDLNLFDIKQLKVSGEKTKIYYRLRKGRFRSIFYLEEENIVKYLSSYFCEEKSSEEKSSLVKRVLTEMYEDIIDRKIIDKFENEKHTFITADDILKEFT